MGGPMKLDLTFMPMENSKSLVIGGQPFSDYAQQSKSLYLASFEPKSFVAGPGVRFVIWVAGCHRRCPGCSQPEYLSFESGRLVLIEELWAKIRSESGIDGVCFSGGEPFEHIKPLAALARMVHEAGLSVVSYTGYRLEALQADRNKFGELLDEVDLLIDGEFRQEETGHYRWRGSANQRLHCLSDRILLPEITQPIREMQITFDASGSEMRFSGIGTQNVADQLRMALAAKGFQMDPKSPISRKK